MLTFMISVFECSTGERPWTAALPGVLSVLTLFYQFPLLFFFPSSSPSLSLAGFIAAL